MSAGGRCLLFKSMGYSTENKYCDKCVHTHPLANVTGTEVKRVSDSCLRKNSSTHGDGKNPGKALTKAASRHLPVPCLDSPHAEQEGARGGRESS